MVKLSVNRSLRKRTKRNINKIRRDESGTRERAYRMK